jgi:coenzyme A diphosphatase NUDT7
MLDRLKPSPDEVDHIFTHPLAAFLDPNLARGESLVDIGSEDWPYEVELHVWALVITGATTH